MRTVANVLIVHAHHEPGSFNGALTRRATDVLTREGHEVVISNLYAMGFNPVSDRRNFTTVKDASYLKQQREESHASAVNGFADDIAREMEKVERCDAMIFQFPLWWFGMPAILKGWVDRVFASGRVYGGGKWYEHGAFKGKRAMISMTTGGPESMFSGWGLDPSLDSILRPIQHGIFWFTGFQPLEPFIAWGAGRATPEQRAAYLDDYEGRLKRLFTDPAIRYTHLSDCDEQFNDLRPRFVAAWTWHGPDSEEVNRLVVEERAHLERWRRDGILLDRFIASDQESGWLVITASGEAAVHELLTTLPLRRWLQFKVTRIAHA